ncbi:MAG TPA: sigma factor-like helix-turn-helix DNA-binding protein [Parafilimonas sp.]|nr:sigma factor-like helix-turn-helix DNA-binding protein [Parafilimonas sp.]
MAKTVNAIVITGDIIASSKLSVTARKKLQNKIDSFIKKISAILPDFKAEQFRGDSVQCILTKNRLSALRTALSLYCYLATDNFKIRQSIGIGEISYSGSNIVTSDGTAFRISGENIDGLKKRNELIHVASAEASFNEEWKAHSASLNYLLERLSNAQAEALYLQLQNVRQEEIAKALKISQPSVHQRLQAAGWAVINPMLQRFETVNAV